MLPGNEYAAELLKQEGNEAFNAGRYEEAEHSYTLAIQKNSKSHILFTNRANARMKLEKWEDVINDCLRSIEIMQDNMKAYFYLAQAQLAIKHPNEALSSAVKAYQFCTESAQLTSNAATISAMVLKCKKAKWDIRERDRLRRRADLLSELEAHMEKDYKASVDEIDAGVESGEIGKVEGKEERASLKQQWEHKVSDLRTAFALSDPEHMQKREVPDYLVDGITFEIMHDPVVTRNGRSYERATLIEHLKRSPMDPLTREPLTIGDLRPNIHLKDACTEFMASNSGWVYDW